MAKESIVIEWSYISGELNLIKVLSLFVTCCIIRYEQLT